MAWTKIIRDKDGKIIEVRGYKAFGPDGRCIYGHTKLEEGKKYHVDGEIKYGVDKGNGYHLSANLVYTLRFGIPGLDQKMINPVIAEVIASGTIVESTDLFEEYIGYYDMFAASDIEIKRFLPRCEIIDYGLSLIHNERDIFLNYVQLTPDEIERFWYNYHYGNSTLLRTQLGIPHEEAYEHSNDEEYFVKKIGEIYGKKR